MTDITESPEPNDLPEPPELPDDDEGGYQPGDGDDIEDRAHLEAGPEDYPTDTSADEPPGMLPE